MRFGRRWLHRSLIAGPPAALRTRCAPTTAVFDCWGLARQSADEVIPAAGRSCKAGSRKRRRIAWSNCRPVYSTDQAGLTRGPWRDQHDLPLEHRVPNADCAGPRRTGTR
jgi:hypothetical protein